VFKKLQETFNPAASAKKTWRKISAAAAFCAAATASAFSGDVIPTPPPLPVAAVQQVKASYWKMDDYEVVLKTWPCDSRGLCSEIHSYNGEDPKVRELIAQATNKSKQVDGPFGITYWAYAPENLHSYEIQGFCGFTPYTDLKKQDDGAWDGTVRSYYHGQTFDLRVEEGDSALKVTGYLPGIRLFGVSMTATRLNQPPPSCG
jgi:hypothetical protein